MIIGIAAAARTAGWEEGEVEELVSEARKATGIPAK
jgi:hypothetical protein